MSALAGGLATLVMAVEEVQRLANPADIAPCSTIEHFSCSSVMADPRAQLLGFPNSLLGLVVFAALLAASTGVLASARPLTRWFWIGQQAATSAGLVLVHVYAIQTSLQIGALCLWSLLVWTATITAFVHVSARNLAVRRARSRQVAGSADSPASAYGAAMITLVWVLMLVGATVGALGGDR